MTLEPQSESRYTETVKDQRQKWQGNGVQGERPYPEKAKRPPARPAIRTPTCSPCSSEKGLRSLPLRRQDPPPTSRKG
ncbi:hypothetical protein XACS582_14400003 [Xanthomonas citri pv. citri]|uniref:Uncharacterized protein n=1 Tax=Xanthomonas citri pv. citri TaxID=611301 RepID=A0A0U5FE40_XANCI|nr:hypothetical protein XAC908_1480065 [Xanthomonas citri pv. citri]CEE28925.1 hypothetical protein XAC2911_1490065 [Xanthomonas citri pv. citri]CEE29183.1 hypothetical protein XAC902_1880005 [Xanthomonas citri pv. citri]CEE36194.1 hypothetical protein XAC3810_340004 [Xanthomonas citri pv. citri]CEE51974.1 hypothetical protein XAC71A_1380054 [Xanthomonas citri pv. citri]